MKRILIVAVSVLFLSGLSTAKPVRTEKPETVMVTFHAKAGAEAQLARVIADHWKTASDLKLVTSSPHLTLRVRLAQQPLRLTDTAQAAIFFRRKYFFFPQRNHIKRPRERRFTKFKEQQEMRAKVVERRLQQRLLSSS